MQSVPKEMSLTTQKNNAGTMRYVLRKSKPYMISKNEFRSNHRSKLKS